MRSFRLDQSNTLQDSPLRAARACAGCHSRKVKCDVSATKTQCSNCQREGLRCQPRERQKRRPRAQRTPVNDSPPSLAASQASESSTPYRNGFMQRAAFIAPEVLEAQDGQEPDYASHIIHGSSVDRQICDLQQAYSLPSRAVQLALFENFWNYCYPWDPIIERSQFMDMSAMHVSPLLLQSICLGGSRLSAASLPSITPHDFYLRAKALFWTNQEKNPLIKIIAVSLLHWWSPHGPELVSTNTSSFWNRIAVSLAMQMGLNSAKRTVPDESLRRRIWWSIVARDCLISAAHGRPQAVNLDYCDVPRPTIHDFPRSSSVAPVFVAYVDLAVIVSRFVHLNLRGYLAEVQASEVGQLLRQWYQALPPALRLSPSVSSTGAREAPSAVEILNTRQLNAIYYAAVAMVYRARNADGPFPTAAVIAASVIAGVFEDLLARDQIRHVGPFYTFILLVSSIALLSCYKYQALWPAAQEDLKIISYAQEEMRKKWPSALGSINSFQKMLSIATSIRNREQVMPTSRLDETQSILLNDDSISNCRMWAILQPTTNITDHIQRANTQSYADTSSYSLGTFTRPSDTTAEVLPTELPMEVDSTSASWHPHVDEWQIDEALFGNYLFWDDMPTG